jgi:hypothetical protein
MPAPVRPPDCTDSQREFRTIAAAREVDRLEVDKTVAPLKRNQSSGQHPRPATSTSRHVGCPSIQRTGLGA